MFLITDPSFHMWVVLGLTLFSVALFTRENIPLEVSSILILTALLLFGQIFPLMDDRGRNLLDAAPLLSGFSNPALVAVIALLVMGQAIIQTDALRPIITIFEKTEGIYFWFSVLGLLVFVMFFSAFLNNTPLVIIAIPILQAMFTVKKIKPSRVMMSLSYVAILGGMTTLIGSSTNLLVSSSLVELGYGSLSFFQFLIPGMIMASIGFVYTIFIVPFLLKDRGSLTSQLIGKEREFIAELEVSKDSNLIGEKSVDGTFPRLANVEVRLIHKSGHLILPPFDDYTIEEGDILIIAATREVLAQMLIAYPGHFISENEKKVFKERDDSEEKSSKQSMNLEERAEKTRVTAEIMVTPASRLIDVPIDKTGLEREYGVVTLGIQRRARVVRRTIGDVRLEAGDVLFVMGKQKDINRMRDNFDYIVLSGSKKDLSIPKKAPVAGAIFLGTILLASTGVLSIAVAAITGSILLIATGCLNIRQATRAIDRKIILLVASMLALGVALEVSGGAEFIARQLSNAPFSDNPLFMASLLFIIVAIVTNILSNNACAILFTPIAVNMALTLGVDPVIFAITVIFAANCSFASPIGYKTNILVMGPGHYQFMDFIKGGAPLVIVLWITYIFIAKFYYGLH